MNIILLITAVGISIISTIYIVFQVFYPKKTTEHSIHTVKQWFTKKHKWYFTLFSLILLWIISVTLTFLYLGVTSIGAISCYTISTLLISCTAYVIYYIIYPSPFWSRHSLLNRKWHTTIDCRSPGEYEKGHYHNAIHWPITTLTPTNLKLRLAQLKSPVLVYDDTGTLSKQWIDLYYQLTHELGIKGLSVSYTDAHWTQIP